MMSTAEILSDNIASLMADRQITSDAQLGKLATIDQKSIWRIRNRDQSPTVDTLEKLASAFGLQAWQMLIPNLDPKNPPVFVITDTERQLYKRLNAVARELIAREPKNGQ